MTRALRHGAIVLGANISLFALLLAQETQAHSIGSEDHANPYANVVAEFGKRRNNEVCDGGVLAEAHVTERFTCPASPEENSTTTVPKTWSWDRAGELKAKIAMCDMLVANSDCACPSVRAAYCADAIQALLELRASDRAEQPGDDESQRTTKKPGKKSKKQPLTTPSSSMLKNFVSASGLGEEIRQAGGKSDGGAVGYRSLLRMLHERRAALLAHHLFQKVRSSPDICEPMVTAELTRFADEIDGTYDELLTGESGALSIRELRDSEQGEGAYDWNDEAYRRVREEGKLVKEANSALKERLVTCRVSDAVETALREMSPTPPNNGSGGDNGNEGELEERFEKREGQSIALYVVSVGAGITTVFFSYKYIGALPPANGSVAYYPFDRENLRSAGLSFMIGTTALAGGIGLRHWNRRKWTESDYHIRDRAIGLSALGSGFFVAGIGAWPAGDASRRWSRLDLDNRAGLERSLELARYGSAIIAAGAFLVTSGLVILFGDQIAECAQRRRRKAASR